MSLTPEYYRFRDALLAEFEVQPTATVRAVQACHHPGCDCGQKAAIIVSVTHIDSLADLEALIVCLRAAAVHVWGPP